MFNLCQKVNVFNIENHYHLYQQNNFQTKHHSNINFQKLKTGSISLTNSLISKRGSKSCRKKKLNLSKNIKQEQNPEGSKAIDITKQVPEKDKKIYTFISHSQSILVSQNLQNTTQNGNNSKNLPTTCYNSLRKNLEIPQFSKQSNTNRKHSNYHSEMERNSVQITRLYSTQHYTTLKKIESIKFVKTPPCLIQAINHQNNNLQYLKRKIKFNQRESKFSSQLNKQRSFFKQWTFKKQSNIQQIGNNKTTESSYLSRYRTNSQISKKQTQNGESKILNNSKYNISHLDSLHDSNTSKQCLADKNQNFYYRFTQTQNQGVRQASIILSNILSRNSNNEKNYASDHKRENGMFPSAKLKFNFEDKQTILSHQNQGYSQCSIKIEQSLICDQDPKDNFIIVQNKSIQNSKYSLNLAIEKSINYLVSLKQVQFRQMGSISQQLQIYQFVSQILFGRQSYRNILQLYQVQTTNSCYILIKQPFTQNVYDYIKNLRSQKLAKVIEEFSLVIKTLLAQFSHHKIYPTRLLNILDFVICDSVIKIQDLSIFKQSKNYTFTFDQIIQNLKFNQIK